VNTDLDRFLVWRAGKISEETGWPMPKIIDDETGTLAEVCGKCDATLAVIRVVRAARPSRCSRTIAMDILHSTE